jgi:hypothetical protein
MRDNCLNVISCRVELGVCKYCGHFNTTNIEKVVIISSTVNTVNFARRCLVNIVNVAKTLNSEPLYCKFFVFDKKTPTSAYGFKFCSVLPDHGRIPLPFGQNG